MIFLDYRGYTMAQVYGYASFIRNGHFDEDFFIQTVLVKMAKMARQYKQYGKLVIAADSNRRKYWRSIEFEHYKASRRNKKEPVTPKDKETKEKVRKIPDLMEFIISENFPFYFIKSPEAEADDVIGTLISHHYDERHIILSADQDFMQMQRYNVDQYDTTRNRWLKTDVPNIDLLEKVIRGDSGDGIPNILSDEDALVNPDKKQTPVTKKKLSFLMNLDYDNITQEQKEQAHKLKLDLVKIQERFKLNEKLIDLSHTPLDVKQDIIERFSNHGTPKNKVMNYALNNRYSILFENLNLFN